MLPGFIYTLIVPGPFDLVMRSHGPNEHCHSTSSYHVQSHCAHSSYQVSFYIQSDDIWACGFVFFICFIQKVCAVFAYFGQIHSVKIWGGFSS